MYEHEYLYRNIPVIASTPIVVCGCGSLGAPIVESLARMGMQQIVVIDFDRVAEHNLSNQPWYLQDVGTHKVRVLSANLARAVRAKIQPIQERITMANAERLFSGAAVVVDALDNRDGRLAVAVGSQRVGAACLHAGISIDGRYGMAQWGDAYPIPVATANMGVDGCDYPSTRTLSMLLAHGAVEVLLQYLTNQHMHGVEIGLPDLSMRRLGAAQQT